MSLMYATSTGTYKTNEKYEDMATDALFHVRKEKELKMFPFLGGTTPKVGCCFQRHLWISFSFSVW
jgi:hypothetical protein